jgi:hypothetical protein
MFTEIRKLYHAMLAAGQLHERVMAEGNNHYWTVRNHIVNKLAGGVDDAHEEGEKAQQRHLARVDYKYIESEYIRTYEEFLMHPDHAAFDAHIRNGGK